MKYFVLLAAFGELPPWDELTADEQEAQMADDRVDVEPERTFDTLLGGLPVQPALALRASASKLRRVRTFYRANWC